MFIHYANLFLSIQLSHCYLSAKTDRFSISIIETLKRKTCQALMEFKRSLGRCPALTRAAQRHQKCHFAPPKELSDKLRFEIYFSPHMYVSVYVNMYFSSKVKLFRQAALEVYCTGGAWIWK